MKSPINNICVFDLETTGLTADKNAILEIACCPFDFNLNDLKEFDSGIMKVYGDREVNEGALMANGITRDQISKGVDSKDVVESLCEYFDRMKVGRNKPVLAGHNIDKFDIPFLDDFFTFHKKDLSKYVNEDLTIDTMWWARLRWEEQSNFKLGTCCESAGIELINAHRAINDTRANKELVKYFLRSFRSDASKETETRFRHSFEF